MYRAILLAGLAAASPTAFAVPITIDVTGTVFEYLTFDNSESGTDQTGTLPHLEATGTFTFDTAAGPAPDVFDNGSYTQRSIGTPLIEFVSGSVTWAGGTFVPAPIAVPAGATELGDGMSLTNEVGSPDLFRLGDLFAWDGGNLNGASSALALTLLDDFIDDGAGIPNGNELPNFATATGNLLIQSMTFTRASPTDVLSDGYLVRIDVTSASLRTVQVPEPGPLALLLAGGLALLVVRRSR